MPKDPPLGKGSLLIGRTATHSAYQAQWSRLRWSMAAKSAAFRLAAIQPSSRLIRWSITMDRTGWLCDVFRCHIGQEKHGSVRSYRLGTRADCRFSR